MVAWGRNVEGQTNVPPFAQSAVVAIAAGLYHSVALKTDGTVIAWGSNGVAQTNVPPNLTRVIAIAAGSNRTTALVGRANALRLSRIGAGVVLSWPTTATGFKLESAPNLEPPVTWSDATDVPTINGPDYTLTIGGSEDGKFCRLSKP